MLRLIACFAVMSAMSFTAHAQGLVDVCLSLARSGLVDSRDTRAVVDIFVDEFRHVCSSSSNRVNRYNNASGGFRGSVIGLLDLGGRGETSSASNEEQVNALCNKGEKAYAAYLQRSETVSTGKYLADSVVQCASILADANEEAIFGLVRVDESDSGFDVQVRYVPGRTSFTYRLTSITNDINCFSSKSKGTAAVGNIILRPNAISAFYCDKPVNIGVLGSFVFSANVGDEPQTQNVLYEARSRNRGDEILSEVEKKINAYLEPLKGGRIIGRGSFGCTYEKFKDIDVSKGWTEICRNEIHLGYSGDFEVVAFVTNYNPPSLHLLSSENRGKPHYYPSASPFQIGIHRDKDTGKPLAVVTYVAYYPVANVSGTWLAISKD